MPPYRAPVWIILTHSVLGFVNFGSWGIVIGELGAMVPARRGEIVQLGLRQILSGTLRLA